MNYGKFHMTLDIMLLCQQVEVNASNIMSQIKLLLVHGTVGTVLVLGIVFMVVFTLVTRLAPSNICWFVL